MGEVADCGKGIFIGSALGCNQSRQFSRRIHIWRGQSVNAGDGGCSALQQHALGKNDFEIIYGDGETTAAIDLWKAWQFAQQPGNLLIHCAAGRCRGPTFGVFAMMARGSVPWHAMHDITAALWQQRRTTPHWCPVPLAELFTWWEKNRWG